MPPLNVAYTEHGSGTALDAQGNQHRQTGSYVAADGSTRAMNDVWFAVDPGQTVDLNPVPVSEEIAALPDVAGMGNLPSMRQAMARDGCRTTARGRRMAQRLCRHRVVGPTAA